MGGNGRYSRDSRQKSETGTARTAVFRGATKVTLDAKGRMAMPTRYRERLAARCEGQIIVTVDKDHCLLVYPLPEGIPVIPIRVFHFVPFQTGTHS